MRIFGVVVAVLLLVMAGGYFVLGYSPKPEKPTLTGQVEEKTLTIGGRERQYVAYTPANLPKGAPLVLVLHGSNLSGRTMRPWTGYEIDALADSMRFAVVYPDGYKGNWNECRKVAPYPAKTENVDDVGFLSAIITAYAPSKAYAFGYSNGGQMALRLAFQAPAVLSGLAIAGVNLPVAENNQCPMEGATPKIMLINGTTDPIMPFEGGEASLFGLSSRGFVLSSNATAETLAKRNGLTAAAPLRALAHLEADDATRVTARTWGSPVHIVQYVVTGGGHVVPQPTFRYPRIFGATSHDLDAPVEAVRFFLGE